MLPKLFIINLLFNFYSFHVDNKKFYDILGVKFSATEDEIKQAYESKLQQLKKAGEYGFKITQINRAYEILSDRTMRSIYDVDGEGEVRTYETVKQYGQVTQRYRKPPAKIVEMTLTLKEAFLGIKKNINFSRRTSCIHCQATGALNGHLEKCGHCDGKGVVFQDLYIHGMRYQVRQGCPHCDEKGVKRGQKCPVCQGTKGHMENKTIMVDIQPGVEDNHEILFEG